MINEILEWLPKRERAYVVGGLLLALLAGGGYALGTFAAERVVAPVDAKIERHLQEQKTRESYEQGLKEAIWSDLRALCAATPNARCDGYTPSFTVR